MTMRWTLRHSRRRPWSFRTIAAFACALPVAASAATIVECVDARGVAILTSSTTGAGCTDANRRTVARVTGGIGTVATRSPTPVDFPRVDVATQRSRDSDRVRILRDELASEEGRLAALESPPSPHPGKAKIADATGRPTDDPSAAFAEQRARTRENIRALQRELAGVH